MSLDQVMKDAEEFLNNITNRNLFNWFDTELNTIKDLLNQHNCSEIVLSDFQIDELVQSITTIQNILTDNYNKRICRYTNVVDELNSIIVKRNNNQDDHGILELSDMLTDPHNCGDSFNEILPLNTNMESN